ncbi:MAG: FKBP-type peptidyl-prolyl cis-trans isomerase [Chitinophagaceae bacterium]|nr:FKBP-type peptidyl-prolyl cis-trans isomerase [Chitinophagaceae bacterium]
MMRKLIFSLALLIALFAGCSKSDDKCNYPDSAITAPANEVQALKNYLGADSLVTLQHPSGFFYKIISPGSGQGIVNLCSNVTIKYTGKLTNGTVFDKTEPGVTATFLLGDLIIGWQKGLPLISKGGTITLYIPPTLGYGPSANGNIPGNSILIFDVELVDIT